MWHIDALASIFAMPWSSWPNAWSRKCRWMSVDAPILSFELTWNVVRNWMFRLRSCGSTGLFGSAVYVQYAGFVVGRLTFASWKRLEARSVLPLYRPDITNHH